MRGKGLFGLSSEIYKLIPPYYGYLKVWSSSVLVFANNDGRWIYQG